MHVLFITPVYPAPGDPMPGVFIQNIAEALARLQVQVTVVHPVPFVPVPAAMMPGTWRLRRDRPYREVSESGVVTLRPRYPSYPRSTIWGIAHLFIHLAVSRVIAKHDLRPDLVHGQFLYPTGHAAIMLGAKLGIPACCTMRGDDVNVFPQRSWLYRRRVVHVLRSADAIMSVSQALARQARLLADVPIQIIRNGVKLGRAIVGKSRHLLRQGFAIDPSKFVVLYVGALTGSKGIGELFQVVESRRDADELFVLVGDRIDHREDIKIPDRCLHLGWRPHAEVLELMQVADVLVLPSYREGMPNVVCEAASVGLPVIATDVGGIPELIDADTGILIPPRSAEALHRAISAVRSDYASARQRAERAKERVHEHFDLESEAARLRDLYSRLLEERSSGMRK
jgi:teichuronic acid biosynthesis glycosyltransferase TuaC